MYFKFWSAADELNKRCVTSRDNAKYVLLILDSKEFKLEDDLQSLLKRKLKMFQFEKIFKKTQCYVMYFTVFSKKDKHAKGPIAEDVSSKMCATLLKKLPPSVTIVGPSYLKNKYNVITIDFLLQCNRLHPYLISSPHKNINYKKSCIDVKSIIFENAKNFLRQNRESNP